MTGDAARAAVQPPVPVYRGSTAQVQGLYPWLYGGSVAPAGAYLGIDCITGGAFSGAGVIDSIIHYKPRVEVVCTNGKYQYSDFNPGARLGRPDYPGFWGQPKMEVRVRIDGYHDRKGWNWVRGHFLAMDKGTVRGALGAQLFNIEVKTRAGYAIAEFSPGGLDLSQVKQACDLTPHKP